MSEPNYRPHSDDGARKRFDEQSHQRHYPALDQNSSYRSVSVSKDSLEASSGTSSSVERSGNIDSVGQSCAGATPAHQMEAEDAPSLLPSKRKAGDSKELVVWPPVVLIENTGTGWDPETHKWKGLENEEIRRVLKGVKDLEYGRVMSLYGPTGHRGKSIVIFPPTHLGYMDAQALCECLQRDKRGREHWQRAKRLQREMRITNDGKMIVFGYLATESDMLDADPKRKIVKRWSMESYENKVLAPIKKIKMEKQEARKKREELAEEAKHKILAVEQHKSEFGKAAAEFKKINEEIQHRKREEEDLETKLRKNYEQRKKQYEEEKLKKADEFQNREKEIRTRLHQNKIAKETEATLYEEKAQYLKKGMDEEKKKHEVRLAEQKQIEVMELMKCDSILQFMMEEKLASLEKSFHEKQLKLQEEHNKQIMKEREEIATEREKFFQSKLKELEEIEKEVKVAKDEQREECIICFEEFGGGGRLRAFFEDCKHANVCSNCASDLLKVSASKKEKLECPTCKTVQTKRFSIMPARIYS